MRWLDLYIDQIHRSTSEWAPPMRFLEDLGPFSRVGSVVNVLACAAVAVGLVVTGLSGAPFGLAPVILPLALEVVFLRTCVRAFRGDFDVAPATEDDDASQS